ncbi:MAG: NAD(P)-dependent oxidoreductase [Parvibaculaceae bacterium]
MTAADPAITDRYILFIGLGRMGAPMAARLAAAGCRLCVWDVRQEAVDAFIKAHPDASSDVTVGGFDVAILMLPNGIEVRNALLGKGADGFASALCLDGIVLDMGSSAADGTRDLGGELDTRGLRLIDAPVSGGVAKAADGTLAIMAGGSPELIEEVKPLLLLMGRKVIHTGPLGSGHAIKALNNLASATGLIIATEAVLVGARFGLSPETIIDVLNASTGRNNSTETKFRPFILDRTFDYGFALEIMRKDLRNAVDLAERTGTYAPMARLCLELWEEASEALGGGADATAIVQHWEKRTGSRIDGRPA